MKVYLLLYCEYYLLGSMFGSVSVYMFIEQLSISIPYRRQKWNQDPFPLLLFFYN